MLWTVLGRYLLLPGRRPRKAKLSEGIPQLGKNLYTVALRTPRLLSSPKAAIEVLEWIGFPEVLAFICLLGP
jgi:hypothetical protein